jgi:hypothetical protein
MRTYSLGTAMPSDTLRALSRRLLSSSKSDWIADQSLIFILFC